MNQNYAPNENELVGSDYQFIFYDNQDKVVKKYICDSESQFNRRNKQAKFQKDLEQSLQQENQQNYILQIQEYTQQQENGTDSFYVKYECDKTSNSLRNIFKSQLYKEKKKIYFFELLKLTKFHKDKNLTHKNMKPSNVILFKDQFFITDFGQINKSYSDFQFIDKLNYKKKKDDQEHIRNLFPYLEEKFITQIVDESGQLGNIEEIFTNRTIEDIQRSDRYALGIMMLELFLPSDQFYNNCSILNCRQESFNRQQQINKIPEINDNVEQFGEENLIKIKEIIENLLKKDEILGDEELNILRKKIDQFQERQQGQILFPKMNEENLQYVNNLIENNYYIFDPKLLYYLSNEQLLNYQNRIINQNSYKDMFEQASSIRRLYKFEQIKKQKFPAMPKEDKFIVLQNYCKNRNKNQLDEFFEKEISKINKINQQDFNFNTIDKNLTKQTFVQIVKQEIPKIMNFMKHQLLLKNGKYQRQYYWDFQNMIDKVIDGKNTKIATETNNQKLWFNYNQQLYIGKLEQCQKFSGDVITENENEQIVVYKNVTVPNLKTSLKSGLDAKIKIYQGDKFLILSKYKGQLENNKRHGHGKIIERAAYCVQEYDGEWQNDQKQQKGKYTILNQESKAKRDYLSFDGITENNFKIKGEMKLIRNLVINKESEAQGYYYLNETIKLFKQGNNYILKTDFLGCCKVLLSKFYHNIQCCQICCKKK